MRFSFVGEGCMAGMPAFCFFSISSAISRSLFISTADNLSPTTSASTGARSIVTSDGYDVPERLRITLSESIVFRYLDA